MNAGLAPSPNISNLSIVNLAEEIKQHNDAVQRNSRNRVCYRAICAACGKNAPFAPHDVRPRNLRYVVENNVVCVVIWLARWRCRHCRWRFTDYPDFRFALQTFCNSMAAHQGHRIFRKVATDLSLIRTARTLFDRLSSRSVILASTGCRSQPRVAVHRLVGQSHHVARQSSPNDSPKQRQLHLSSA